MNQRPLWPVIVATLLLAGLAAVIAFNVGVHRGMEQGAKLVPPQGADAYRYPYPYYGWHPWGFGFFLVPLFFFLWFVVIRGLLWRGGWHRHGCGPHDPDEWHRRMHERMENRSA